MFGRDGYKEKKRGFERIELLSYSDATYGKERTRTHHDLNINLLLSFIYRCKVTVQERRMFTDI